MFWRSSASILGMLAALFAAIAAMKDHLSLLQPLISPAKYAAVVLVGDSSAGIAATLAAAVPFARIIKQDKLRELTGAANPQPGAGNGTN